MMEKLLRVLFLLCAIAAPGHSLSCLTCAAKDSTCKGISMTCPTGSSCGLAYQETTEDGITTKDYIKSCVPSNKCIKVGSMSYNYGQMKMGISCCKTDNCTPRPPKLPADSIEVNGLTCPTCRSTTSNSCDSESDIECTGNEQMCINQNTTSRIRASRWSSSVSESRAMGCATQSLCDIKDFFYENGGSKIAVEFSCDSGSNSAESSDAENKPLSCVTCISDDSLDCNGELEQCPPNHECASAYRVILSGAAPMFGVARSCIPKNKCDASGSMSLTKERLLMGTSCCNKDGCTPSIKPPKNPVNTRPNGVKCKICTSSTSDSCETTNTMECSGDENQCVNYAILLTSESQSTSLSMRGCGVPALCKMQSYSYTIKNFKIENRFTCTKG